MADVIFFAKFKSLLTVWLLHQSRPVHSWYCAMFTRDFHMPTAYSVNLTYFTLKLIMLMNIHVLYERYF